MRTISGMFISFLFFLSSCGSTVEKKKESENDAEKGKNRKGDVVLNLTSTDQENFDKWKRSLFKSCDAHKAFPQNGVYSVSSLNAEGIDGKLFLEKLNFNTIVKSEAGHFYIFSQPQSFSGSKSTKITRHEESSGGNTYRLDVEFKQSGSNCEAWVSGEKVYSTKVYSNILVNGFWSGALASSKSTTVYSVPKQYPSFSTANGHGFATEVWQALSPGKANKEDNQFFANLFGIQEKDAELFFLPSISWLPMAIDFPAFPDIQPFSFNYSTLMGSTESLNTLLKHPENYPLRVKLPPPKFFDGNTVNKDWVSNLTLTATLHFKSVDKLEQMNYQFHSLQLEKNTPFDDDLAVNCLATRTTYLKARWFNISPATNYLDSSEPCKVMSKDFNQAILSHGKAKSTILDIFKRIPPAKNAVYSGWDELLRQLNYTVLLRGENLADILDPEKVAPGIQNGVHYSGIFFEGIKQSPELTPYRHLLLDIGFGWGLYDEQVPHGFIDDIFKAVLNTHSDFYDSTNTLINMLRAKPMEQEKILQFAMSIDAAYKESARSLKEKLSALELNDLSFEIFSRILQKKISLESLTLAHRTIDSTKSFKEREVARMRSQFSTYSLEFSNFKSLIARAYLENWSDKQFNLVEQIAPVNLSMASCEHHKDVSSLLNCNGFDKISIKSGKLLDPEFKNRYGSLAKEVVAWSNALSDFSYYSIRSSLNSGFFRPLWAKCDDAAFAENMKHLKEQIKSYTDEKDWFKHTEHERAIRSTLDLCN